MQEIKDFGSLVNVLPLDEDVIRQAISLCKKYKKIKFGDAIIAATALANNLLLISRDMADFINIERLEVVNPHNLNLL